MKRKGETFAEFLTAAAVFGVMMVGIVEFMANQTENLARIITIDETIYYAQRYNNGDTANTDKIHFSTQEGGKILIVSRGTTTNGIFTENTSMDFKLKP